MERANEEVVPQGIRRRSLAWTVIGGTGIIASAGAASKLFSLVSSPILTRLLGPSPYGVVALLGTVTSLATTAALMGLDHSYARFFFDGTSEKKEAVERFCWRLSLASAVLVSVLAGGGWWVWSSRADLPGSLALMVTIGVFLFVLNSMAVTRQRLKGAYRRIAVSITATGGSGAVLAILLALFWRKDAWTMLVAAAGGTAIGILIAGLPSKETILRKSGLPRPYLSEVMRLGLAGAAITPMFWLMNSVDRWFIGMWQGQGPLGIYAFSMTVGTIGLMVNNAVTITWFPEATRIYEDSGSGSSQEIGRMWSRLVGAYLVVWLAVTAAGGDTIRVLADRRFHEGAAYVPWLAGGIFFYGIGSLANTGLLLRKDLSPVVVWWGIGALANIAMNYFLIRRIGPYGAAVAGCVSYAIIAFGVMRSAQGRFRLPIPWGPLAWSGSLTLLAGLVMGPPWSPSPVLSLCLKFPAGVVCAAVLMWIVAPDWAKRLWEGESPWSTS